MTKNKFLILKILLILILVCSSLAFISCANFPPLNDGSGNNNAGDTGNEDDSGSSDGGGSDAGDSGAGGSDNVGGDSDEIVQEKLIAVKGTFGANTWKLEEGTTVYFRVGTGTKMFTVESDNTIDVENLPNGEYTVWATGYKTKQVEILDDTKEISFMKDVFVYSSNYTVSSDETSFNCNGANSTRNMDFVSVPENAIIKYTAKSSNVNPYGMVPGLNYQYMTNTGLFIYSGSQFMTMNLLVWGSETSATFSIKSQNEKGETLGSANLNATDYVKFNGGTGLEVMVVKIGSVFSSYVNRNGAYEHILTVDYGKPITKMSWSYWDNPIVKVSNFSYSELRKEFDTFSVTVKDSVDGQVHGTATANKVEYGTGYDIFVTLDEGYGISYVKFNDEILQVDGNNVIKNGVYTLNNNVEIFVEKIVTINGILKYKGEKLKNRYFELYEHDTGFNLDLTSDENGFFTFTKPLSLGKYTITNYQLGTVDVNITEREIASGELSVEILPFLFQNETGWTKNDNALIYKNNSTSRLYFDKGYLYGEMTVYNPFSNGGGEIPATTVERGATMFLLGNGYYNASTSFGLVYKPNSGWAVRFTNYDNWTQYKITGDAYTRFCSTGLKIAVKIGYDTITAYKDDGTGNLAVVKTISRPSGVTQVTGIATDLTYAKVSDMIFNDGAPIETKTFAVTGGRVNVLRASNDSIELSVEETDGYYLSDIKVNGNSVQYNYNKGFIIFKYEGSEIAEITPVFSNTYTVYGTLTGDNQNNTFTVYKGEKVVLTNEKNTYETFVTDNGNYRFTGVIPGEYTFKVAKSNALTLTVDKSKNYSPTVLYEIKNDTSALTYTSQTNSNYDKTRYYSNLTIDTVIADPAVIEITDETSEYYGEYFMYGTTDASIGFHAYRSKDLVDWQLVSLCFNVYGGWEEGSLWAPEVYYEKDANRAKYGLGEGTGVYFFFYSAFTSIYNSCALGLAVGTSPAGPFSRYIGTDSLGRFIDRYTPWMEVNTVHEVLYNNYGFSGRHNIDPTPFVDVDGKKYLFMTAVKACSFVDNDWSQIDYSSFTQIVSASHNFVSASDANKFGDTYEAFATATNEGPQVYYKDGLYYLTISVDGYQDKSYSVIQLVAKNVLGPYKKLTGTEGGIIISGSYGNSDDISSSHKNDNSIDNLSGPGHHAFINIGGNPYIIYHRHEYFKGADGNYTYENPTGYRLRYVAIDPVTFVTNSDGLTVMKCNGVTSSVQPLSFETGATQYKNIISDASISVSSVNQTSNTDALTDNLLQIFKVEENYINEFNFTGNASVTATFSEYKRVSAIAIYNSRYYEKMFIKVDVEIDGIRDGVIGKYTASGILFNEDYYDTNKGVIYPAGTVVIDVGEMLVKSAKITAYSKSGNLGAISELKILGIHN